MTAALKIATLAAMVATVGIAQAQAQEIDPKAWNHPLTKAIAEHAATLAACEPVQGPRMYARQRAEAEKELATILPKGTPTAETFDAPRRAVRKAGEEPPSGERCQMALMRTTEAFSSEVRKVFLEKSARKVDAQNAKAVDEVAAWVKAERAKLDALPSDQRTLAAGAITYVTTWGICRWSISNEDMMRDLVILRLSTIKGHPWAVDAVNRVENEVTPQSFGGSGDQSNNTYECEKNLEAIWRKLEWAQARARLAREARP